MKFTNTAYTGEIFYNSNNGKFYLKVADADTAFYKLQSQAGNTTQTFEVDTSTPTGEVTAESGFKYYALPTVIDKSADAATASTYELLAYADADYSGHADATGFYYFDNSGLSFPATATGTDTGAAPTTPYTAPAT